VRRVPVTHASHGPDASCMWPACPWHVLACTRHAQTYTGLHHVKSLSWGWRYFASGLALPGLILSVPESWGWIHEGIGFTAQVCCPCFFTIVMLYIACISTQLLHKICILKFYVTHTYMHIVSHNTMTFYLLYHALKIYFTFTNIKILLHWITIITH